MIYLFMEIRDSSWYKTTLQEKIRLSARLDKACNGGSIAHYNLDAPLKMKRQHGILN